ncbi:MAG: hypothetical protein AMXMBFR56_32230 [Polyangiaceae bacterium]
MLAGLAVIAALLACSDPDPRCATLTGQIPGTLSLDACSDGRRREVACTRDGPGGDWMCACMRNATLGRTFNWPSTARTVDAKEGRELEPLLSRQCHWSLRLH